jgi:hypothetical protein
MKRYLLLLLALPLLISSCTKTVLVNDNRVSGRWILLYAEREDVFGVTTMYTGYEDGLFYFYDNGQAVYDDGYDLMKGDWDWFRINNGYYDFLGRYQGGSRDVFSLYLRDPYSGRTLNWEFDESWFNNSNQFTAVYNTDKYQYYYVFQRQ